MPAVPLETLSEMIQETRVDKRVYTDQDVFDLEMERLFARTWIYAGHTSQIANPGDYVTTEIGNQPVIVVRSRNNDIKVLLNHCPHRGAIVVNEDSGHATRFVCRFHAYSFNTDGSAAGIPLEDSYDGTAFGRCDPEMKLKEVAAVDTYRGFIFVCLNSVNMPLVDWLGATTATIDNFIDRSPLGEVEVVGRPYRWVNRCNWKMLIENLVDGTHVNGTHPSIGQTADRIAREYEEAGGTVPPIVEMAGSFWQKNDFIRKMGITLLPNGHCYNGGKVSIHSGYAKVDAYGEALEGAYGADRAAHILSQQRHNTAIYPNLHIKTMIQKIRIFKPIGPDKTVVECWVFRLKGAPDEVLQRTLTYAEMLDSPGALVSTDDLEVMIRQQNGFHSSASNFVNFQRGVKRPTQIDGDAVFCEGDSEQAFVKQFETWKTLMCTVTDE